MRITREHTVWCERCNHWEQEQIKSAAQFAKKMRREGWRMRNGKTVCPSCVTELKDGRDWDAVGYRHVNS